jgi:hypothetical protein
MATPILPLSCLLLLLPTNIKIQQRRKVAVLYPSLTIAAAAAAAAAAAELLPLIR